MRLPDLIDDVATLVLDRNSTPGAVVAVITDHEVILSGVGFRDLERTVPVEADALMPIYSITKTFIATAILKQVEHGLLTLDQPVVSILPRIAIDRSITVLQLLNHSSGLPDYGRLVSYRDDLRERPESPWTPEDFLQRTLVLGPLFSPGEGWMYSNIGYLLLKLVLEQVGGTSFQAIVARDIAEPLGLFRTSVAKSLDEMRDVSPGYSTVLDGGELHDISRRYHPGWVSHGLIVSTAADIARFLHELMGGNVLRSESMALMSTPVRVPIVHHPLFREPSYGLGVMIDPAGSDGIITGHGGSGPGYSAGALHLSKHDGGRVTAVAIANCDQGDIGLEVAWNLLGGNLMQ